MLVASLTAWTAAVHSGGTFEHSAWDLKGVKGSSNYPLRGYKTSFFEGGCRGAALVAGGSPLLPQRLRGTRTRAGPLHLADLFVTFRALAKIEPQNNFPAAPVDGVDIMPLILGDVKERPAAGWPQGPAAGELVLGVGGCEGQANCSRVQGAMVSTTHGAQHKLIVGQLNGLGSLADGAPTASAGIRHAFGSWVPHGRGIPLQAGLPSTQGRRPHSPRHPGARATSGSASSTWTPIPGRRTTWRSRSRSSRRASWRGSSSCERQ